MGSGRMMGFISNVCLIIEGNRFSYLANGGDKMSFFTGKKQELVGIKVRDAIINHCLANDTIASKLDNRLSIIE